MESPLSPETHMISLQSHGLQLPLSVLCPWPWHLYSGRFPELTRPVKLKVWQTDSKTKGQSQKLGHPVHSTLSWSSSITGCVPVGIRYPVAWGSRTQSSWLWVLTANPKSQPVAYSGVKDAETTRLHRELPFACEPQSKAGGLAFSGLSGRIED